MDMKELLDFIELESKRLREMFKVDDEKFALGQNVKLMEEMGELSSEVLTHLSLQRKRKLDNHDKENIQDEFADVMFTTLILSKAMNVDIEKALKSKIKKINKRYEY